MLGIRTLLRKLIYPVMPATPHRIRTEIGPLDIPHVDAYSKSWLQRSATALNRWHEPSLTWFLMLAGGRGGKRGFVDAGSHLGYFSLVHARHAQNRAVAIEVNPTVFSEMSAMIAKSALPQDRISCLNVGLSSAEGVLSLPRRRSHSPAFSIAGKSAPEASGVTVPLVTLDSIVDQQDISVDLLKIDVEGAEMELLRGAETVLRKFQPVIAIELHPDLISQISGQSAQSLVDMMQGLGYREFQFLSGRGKACTRLEPGYHPEMSANPNLVLVSEADLDLVEIYNETVPTINDGRFPTFEATDQGSATG